MRTHKILNNRIFVNLNDDYGYKELEDDYKSMK